MHSHMLTIQSVGGKGWLALVHYTKKILHVNFSSFFSRFCYSCLCLIQFDRLNKL